ncbi:hypothetical protein ACFY19_21155 [Streptosporangium saharense]|uniref:hypothetical protein n=1 Tax=Streptosporangium saharense TaxID=1706840 RepID=UPI00368FB12B
MEVLDVLIALVQLATASLGLYGGAVAVRRKRTDARLQQRHGATGPDAAQRSTPGQDGER